MGKGMQITHFVFDDEGRIQAEKISSALGKYSYNIELVYLSRNSSEMNFFYVPKFGYAFYFMNDNNEVSTYGYEFHRFHGMENYKAYRMHGAETEKKVSVLKKIKSIGVC